MSRPTILHHVLFSLLIVFLAFTSQISATVPAPLATISNPILPHLNTSLRSNPPLVVVQIDATHRIYFTQYRHLVSERNYFAAIISLQTSLMFEYFSRRVERLEPGAVSLDVFGANILVDNPTGLLTYAMTVNILGELAEFLMEGNFCAAKFELWEVQVGNVKQLSVGRLVPGYIAKTAV